MKHIILIAISIVLPLICISQNTYQLFLKNGTKSEQITADSLYGLDEYKSALSHYDNEIHYFKELSQQDSNTLSVYYSEITKCYNMKGNCEFQLNEFCQAAIDIEKASSILSSYSKYLPDMNDVPLYQEGSADCYAKCNNYSKALELYNDAFYNLEQNKESISDYYSIESEILDKMGDIYHKQGNEEKAKIYYQKSVQIKTK